MGIFALLGHDVQPLNLLRNVFLHTIWNTLIKLNIQHFAWKINLILQSLLTLPP